MKPVLHGYQNQLKKYKRRRLQTDIPYEYRHKNLQQILKGSEEFYIFLKYSSASQASLVSFPDRWISPGPPSHKFPFQVPGLLSLLPGSWY